ncbi:MAG: protoglobin domain-containing protein [Polyangiales bacterium]
MVPEQFIEELKARTQFGAAEAEQLTQARGWGEALAPEAARRFYAAVFADAAMKQIIEAAGSPVARLEQTLMAWFAELFHGIDEWGTQYAQRRWRIGLVHVRIGVRPAHVVPAMSAIHVFLCERVLADGKSIELLTALMKITAVDLAFIEQAYYEVSRSSVQQETGWSSALFERLVSHGVQQLEGV